MTAYHPATAIKARVLPLYDWNVAALAKALKMSRPAIYRLLNAEVSLTFTVARRLEAAGHGSARDWLIQQIDYDLALYPDKHRRSTAGGSAL